MLCDGVKATHSFNKHLPSIFVPGPGLGGSERDTALPSQGSEGTGGTDTFSAPLGGRWGPDLTIPITRVWPTHGLSANLTYRFSAQAE